MRTAGIAIVIVSWLAVVLGLSARWRQPPALLPPPVMRLTVFDVGQAEALLLESPGVGPLMIDAAGVPFGGGGFDVARRVLAPAMWARGVRSLDTLLITHGDPDHAGGAAGIIDVFAPRRLWTGVPVPRHQPSQEIVARAARSGLDVREVRRPDTRAWGAARIRVLHPPEPDWERQRVRNDDSVVIEVVLGDVALLLTGDISAEIERAIAPQLTPAAVRILKVAHHGSRTSTSADILNAWRPQIALISCGRDNTFGHPAREVRERLDAAGVQVFRTDRDGQITLETDGRQVRVRTFWEGGR